MKLGITMGYGEGFENEIKWMSENGIPTCQLGVGDASDEDIKNIKSITEKYGIEITSLIAGYPGPSEWNFYGGPLTLGLVPAAYRWMRMENLIKSAEIAVKLGVSDVNTHMGFIPENPNDQVYKELVVALKYIAEVYKQKGLRLNFETGQETPVTLLRILTDIGYDNLGLNFDPANLLMYGKANPVDALDIVGKFVNGVHAKDGEYPTDGVNLGVEKALGEGRVNFPAFIAKLKQVGYDGALTIEREISGEQQKLDIIKARDLLNSLI